MGDAEELRRWKVDWRPGKSDGKRMGERDALHRSTKNNL